MRNALIRLAPCALFVSSLASAQQAVEVKVGGTNSAAPVTPGMGLNPMPAGMTPGMGPTNLSLQGPLGTTPTPAPMINGAPAAAQVSPVNGAAAVVPAVGNGAPAAAIKGVPGRTPGMTPLKAQASPLKSPGSATHAVPGAVSGAAEAKGASGMLDDAAKGIEQGKKAEAEGGDGTSVRRALDRAYDSTTRGGDVAGVTGVAGKFSSAREKVANLVGVANNSTPADAPGLYGSAIQTAEEALPASAAAAVTKAVLSFAARKAEVSLSDLAQAAYAAATAGQAAETRRLVKSLDKWEQLLGSPGQPLIANGDRLKAGVESALGAAVLSGPVYSGAQRSAPRVWVVKRGGSYVAALPGTSVEKVPGLGASFALKLEKMSTAPLAMAYRAFAAKPGIRSAIGARVALGESVPSAALSTGWLWIKHMAMRAWTALASLLPGRGLPSVANASTLPRLRAAAGAWRDAAVLGDAAALAAGSPRLTVSRARGAFALARRSAAAHEVLSGEAGAVARVEALASEFEAGVKRSALSGADRLTPGLESIVSGDGGLRHWASRYASDARERGATAFGRLRGEKPVVVLGEGAAANAAASISAASKDLTFTAFGDALWASGSGSYGPVKVSADLRSTENGGSVVLETERGDEKLAAALDGLGFLVTRRGRGLLARLDAETSSLDAQELTEIAADGASLITGGSPRPAGVSTGLDRLLADMKRSPEDAAKVAASLDGSSLLSRAKTVGWVGENEAVTAELRSRNIRAIALRDPATRLLKFARVEPLRLK